jgi:predicted TIM-barrel fold metal-dependent hydrolase
LSHTIGGVEGVSDPAGAMSTAQRANDFLAGQVARSGGRFAGFAAVPLQDTGEAVTLPFFAWRIHRAFEYNPYSRRTAKRLQDYFSDNIWVTTSGNFNDQALITAILTMGADRIMFASDYPYDMAADAARWIETAPISENDRRKIC